MPTFDASTDRLLRTSGVLSANSPYTVMAWIRASSISGAPCIFAASAGTYSANGEELYISVSLGNRLTLYAVNGGTDGFGSPNGTVLSVDTWYHVAIVREGNTTLKSYLNGVLDSTCTVSVASRTATTRMEFGAWSSGNNDPFSGRIQYIKAWNVALTAAEIAQEMYTVAPRKLANLWGWWPGRPGSGERAKDYSGNGRDFTEGGTLTDEDPPPISWGARSNLRQRISAATQYSQSVAGTLTSAGALARQTGKALGGTLTSAGALARRMGKVLAGTLTSAGALTKQVRRALAGTLSSAGALARQAGKALAGTLSSAGTLARRTNKILAGTLTSAGALVKQTRKALAGTLTSSGTLSGVRLFLKVVAGTLTSAGTLARRTSKPLAGMLTSAGALTKRTSRALAGTLTSAGALASVRVYLKAVAGTLSSSGALAKRTGKTLAGTLSSAGTLARRIAKTLAGTLSSTGALVRQTRKVLGGTLTSSGGAAILRAVAYLRNRFRVSADAPADIPALGRSFTVAADAPAQIPAGGRSFTVAADAASEQL